MGCAGFGEAVRDGLSTEFGGQPLRVRFERCERLRLPTGPAVESVGRVGLVRVADGGSGVIGEKYKAGAGMRRTDIVLEGDPGAALVSDVRDLLQRRGVDVIDGEASGVRVETAVAGVESWTRAGVTQVTTSASTSLLVRLRVDGRLVWSRFFDGRHEATMTAVLTSDLRKTVNEAYCRALEILERFVDTAEFRATAGLRAD